MANPKASPEVDVAELERRQAEAERQGWGFALPTEATRALLALARRAGEAEPLTCTGCGYPLDEHGQGPGDGGGCPGTEGLTARGLYLRWREAEDRLQSSPAEQPKAEGDCSLCALNLARAKEARDGAELRQRQIDEHKVFIQRLLEAAGLCDPESEDEAVEAIADLLQRAEQPKASEVEALRAERVRVVEILLSVACDCDEEEVHTCPQQRALDAMGICGFLMHGSCTMPKGHKGRHDHWHLIPLPNTPRKP